MILDRTRAAPIATALALAAAATLVTASTASAHPLTCFANKGMQAQNLHGPGGGPC